MTTMPQTTSFDKRLTEALDSVLTSGRQAMADDPGRVDEVVRAAVHLLGEQVLSVIAEEMAESRVAAREWDACDACGGALRFRQRRTSHVRTVLTGAAVPIRCAYLQCAECRTGLMDIPRVLGTDSDGFTPALREMAVYSGTLEPFEHAAGQLLPRLAGVTVSGSKVHTLCQWAGDVGKAVLATGELGTISRIEPTDRLYVEVDGGMCWIDDGWHEVKIGIIVPERALADVSKDRRQVLERMVVATRGSVDEFTELMDSALRRILPKDADGAPIIGPNVLVIADGAEWIRGMTQTILPGARQVVDWFHVAEYIAEAAKATYENPATQPRWRTR
ncbi:MAG: hypothetical protein ACI9OJ_002857 [Myxococcota bacterium]|jgi:hypothetical protein